MSPTNITIKVDSAGLKAGNSAKITINGAEIGFGNYTRGLNVAIFDETTGTVVSCATFDTFISGNVEFFAHFIEQLPHGRIVAIAVKDDAQSGLITARSKAAFASIGAAKFLELQFQGSWAIIGQKGALPGTATEEVSNTSAVSVSSSFTVQPVALKSFIVQASSASPQHKVPTHITLNGTEIPFPGGYQKGFNVAVIDEKNGSVLINRAYDVSENAADADAFVRLVDELTQGRVVAIATSDKFNSQLISDSVKLACYDLGSVLCFYVNGIWAMVGAKGAKPGVAIENLDNTYSAYPDYLLLAGVSAGCWFPPGVSLAQLAPQSPPPQTMKEEMQKLQPADLQRDDRFGYSVAISGEVAIVGAYFADAPKKPNAGAAYIYQLSNGIWDLKQKLQPPDLQGDDRFGISVAISGELAIAGAERADAADNLDAGAAYIYKLSNDTWEIEQKLQPADLGCSHFGTSVALSGELAIAGARKADAPDKPNAGAAYIYQLSNGMWELKQKLQPSDLQSGDNFGISVAISGEVAIAGVYPDVVPGKENAGAVYIFQLSNDTWELKQKLQPSDLQSGDNFGISVAISGEVAIAGAPSADAPDKPNAGAAYIFQLSNGSWELKQKLQPADLQRDDRFGISVAVSGEIAIAGAYWADSPDNPEAGAVYIYQLSNGIWELKQTLQPADLQRGDYFGRSVAFSGEVAIAGAEKADTPCKLDAGAAYVFQFN